MVTPGRGESGAELCANPRTGRIYGERRSGRGPYSLNKNRIALSLAMQIKLITANGSGGKHHGGPGARAGASAERQGRQISGGNGKGLLEARRKSDVAKGGR